MRVIGGSVKGTKLESFKGASIRPTLDRVKESFFNQVSPVIDGAYFLDLFAGSGSIGIEALSRGAAKVVFVENHPPAQALIYKNLQKCRFWDGKKSGEDHKWFLLKSDALHAIKILDSRDYRFDLVYIDPPFDAELYEDCLMMLSASGLLKETSRVIVEHYHKTVLLENYGKISLIRKRKIGDTCLSFFGYEAPGKKF